MPTVSAPRKHAAALLLLALATVCCFHKLVRHPDEVLVGPQNRGSNDLVDYFIPSREFATRTIRESGELPFWNPNVCLGLPYTGNPQAALYYPPNWIGCLLPAGLILSWLLVAHHLFAGAGVYLLARRHGLGWCAGVIGGMIFLAAPFLVAQSAEGHYAQICAIAWTPWAFFAYEAIRDGRPHAPALLALCLVMSFFAGHAQETYYLVLLLSGFVVWDVASRIRSGSGGAARLLGAWIRVGLYTVGLVAIDLLPIYINSRMTLRTSSAQNADDLGWSAFGVANLQQLLAPFALSRPELWQPGITQFWETVCFFGLVPLVLSMSGIGMARRSPFARRMTALWLVTLLFAFGTNGPLFSWMAAIVPGLDWFRFPSRILFFTSFATAMLAAVAVDQTLLRLSTERIRLPLQYLAIALSLAGGWWWLTVRQSGATDLPHSMTAALLGPALLVAAGTIVRRGALPIVAGGLAAMVVLELSLFAHEVTDTTHVASLAERDAQLLKILVADDESMPPTRTLALQGVVSDSDAGRYGLQKLRGYEPAGPASYLLLIQNLSADGPPVDPMGFDPTDPDRLQPQLLDLLNIRYAVQSRPDDSEANVPEGWTRIHSGHIVERTRLRRRDGRTMYYEYEVLTNKSPLPRAFVVGSVRELHSWSEFTGALAEIDFRKEVVLEKDVLPVGARSEYRPARVTEYSTNFIEMEAELDAPGYLVISDLWFPGWTVETETGSLPVLRANMAFRAVPLPAGVHHVRWTFRPPGLIPGALVSAVTLVMLVISSLSRVGAVLPERLSLANKRGQRELVG